MGGIVETYQKTRKRPDLFWNTYVCRPPAAVIVHLLAGTRVTPNQITLSAFVVASGAAAMIALLPGYWGLLAGVLVFQFSYVLDCVDGMLARLRGIQSPVGHLLDFLMDEIKAFVLLGAVAVRLFHRTPGSAVLGARHRGAGVPGFRHRAHHLSAPARGRGLALQRLAGGCWLLPNRASHRRCGV